MINGFKGLTLPGVKLVTLSDLVRHIHGLCEHVPDLGFVIIAGRKGQVEDLACMSNVDREAKLAMLTKVREAIATGGAVAPMPGKEIL